MLIICEIQKVFLYLINFKIIYVMISTCCGAEALWETDLCSDCKEHTEFVEETDY